MKFNIGTIIQYIQIIATIITPFLLVYIVFITNRKNQLQQQLNDKKREMYEKFTDVLEQAMSISNGQHLNKAQLSKKMNEFKKKLVVYSSPESIKAYNKWIMEGRNNNMRLSFENVENLIKALRNEIGLSNKGLKKYDIIQIYVNEDIEKAMMEQENKTAVIDKNIKD